MKSSPDLKWQERYSKWIYNCSLSVYWVFPPKVIEKQWAINKHQNIELEIESILSSGDFDEAEGLTSVHYK
jgi:hypothetical protein